MQFVGVLLEYLHTLLQVDAVRGTSLTGKLNIHTFLLPFQHLQILNRCRCFYFALLQTRKRLLGNCAIISLVILCLLHTSIIEILLLVVIDVLKHYLAIFYQTSLEHHVFLSLLILYLFETDTAWLLLHGVKANDQPCP